jgi:hypothetical protein
MTAIASFASAIDADLADAADPGVRVSVQVIGVALDDGVASEERLHFLIVDRDGRGRLVGASSLVFTDDAVMPPKYG